MYLIYVVITLLEQFFIVSRTQNATCVNQYWWSLSGLILLQASDWANLTLPRPTLNWLFWFIHFTDTMQTWEKLLLFLPAGGAVVFDDIDEGWRSLRLAGEHEGLSSSGSTPSPPGYHSQHPPAHFFKVYTSLTFEINWIHFTDNTRC